MKSTKTNSSSRSKRTSEGLSHLAEVAEQRLHSDSSANLPQVDNLDERLFHDLFPNTELSVDLKLLTRRPGRLTEGEIRQGSIARNSEDHFTFVEGASEEKAIPSAGRNPHVYRGKFVNVSRSADGRLYPSLRRPAYNKNFRFKDLCREAASELQLLQNLVGED